MTWKATEQVYEEEGVWWGARFHAQDCVRRFWEAKFGPIPKPLHDRLTATTDLECLDRAIDLLLTNLDRPDESILDPTP